jgi:hypothetical protein
MKFFRKYIISFYIFFGLTSFSFADYAIIDNGDRITGNIERIDSGIMIIKPSYAGKLSINMNKVKEFVKTTLFYLDIKNKGQKKYSSVKFKKGKWEVRERKTSKAVYFSNKDVNGLNMVYCGESWGGNISFGMLSVKSTSDRFNYNLSSSVSKRKANSVLGLKFNLMAGENEGVKNIDRGRLSGKYDIFYTQLNFISYNAKVEYDNFKNLKLRSIVGVDIGRLLMKDKGNKLTGRVGLLYSKEHLRGNRDNKKEGIFKLGEDFSYKLWGGWTLKQDFDIYFSLDDLDDYRLDLEINLQKALTSRISLIFKLDDRYDNLPSPNIGKNDFYFTTSIRYAF